MRRPHGFYIRVRVPADLVDRVGVVELRRALGPMPLHLARSLASQAGSRLKGVFEMLREIDSLSDVEVANLIKDAFAHVRSQVDRPYVVQTADPWFERQEQRHYAEEHLFGLEQQRDTGAFAPEVIRLAEQIAASKGISLPGGSPERLRIIAEGFARVLAEADRCFMHRLIGFRHHREKLSASLKDSRVARLDDFVFLLPHDLLEAQPKLLRASRCLIGSHLIEVTSKRPL